MKEDLMAQKCMVKSQTKLKQELESVKEDLKKKDEELKRAKEDLMGQTKLNQELESVKEHLKKKDEEDTLTKMKILIDNVIQLRHCKIEVRYIDNPNQKEEKNRKRKMINDDDNDNVDEEAICSDLPPSKGMNVFFLIFGL